MYWDTLWNRIVGLAMRCQNQHQWSFCSCDHTLIRTFHLHGLQNSQLWLDRYFDSSTELQDLISNYHAQSCESVIERTIWLRIHLILPPYLLSQYSSAPMHCISCVWPCPLCGSVADWRDIEDNVRYSMTQWMLLLGYASFGEYIERINRVVMVVVVDWTDDARVECRGSEYSQCSLSEPRNV